MKSEKGITLISVIMYVLIMVVLIGLVATLITYFNNNISLMDASSGNVAEYNKFNMYFIEDIKTNNQALVENLVNQEGENFCQIAFADGDIYTYTIGDDSIYKNSQKIASNIEDFTAEEYRVDEKTCIRISIRIGTKDNANYTKTIEYVLKYW